MQPNRIYQSPLSSNRKLLGILVAVVALVVIAIIGWQLHLASTFHIVRTDPSTSNVAAISPYVKVYFNRPIVKDNLSVDSGGAISGLSVNGKVVTLNLNPGLVVKQRYTITFKYVESESGDQLRDKALSFVTKDINYDDLSKDQQKALVSRQDHFVYSVNTINYLNFDAFLDSGISADQLTVIKQEIFEFSNNEKKQFKTVALQPKTMVTAPYNPDSGGSTQPSMAFVLKIDDTSYNAKLNYSGTDYAQLLISDQAGNLVYRPN